MSGVLASQECTRTPTGTGAPIAHDGEDLGKHIHGFHHQSPKITGSYDGGGHAHQDDPFHAMHWVAHGVANGMAVYVLHLPATWLSLAYYVRSRYPVHDPVLACTLGTSAGAVISLILTSSGDGWRPGMDGCHAGALFALLCEFPIGQLLVLAVCIQCPACLNSHLSILGDL